MANHKLLSIYLNDHLAGSTAGLELARRTLGANRGTQFEPVLGTLAEEIDEDRAALRDIMRALEIGEDPVKKIGAFVFEKVGRLKLNGSLFSYSPLSRLVEFEGVALGVTGKLALWRALQQVDDPRLAEFDLPALEARASAQQDAIEEQRREAARLALDGG
jgi:hypothetical protein